MWGAPKMIHCLLLKDLDKKNPETPNSDTPSPDAANSGAPNLGATNSGLMLVPISSHNSTKKDP